MLEQLIESKSDARTRASRIKYLATTLVLVVGLAFSGVLWSLFAKDLAIGSQALELSTMLAPVTIPENAPLALAPSRPKQSPKQVSNEASRQTNTLRIEESPKAPNAISVVPSAEKARPNGAFKITLGPEVNSQISASVLDRATNNQTDSDGISFEQPVKVSTQPIDTPPPPIKKTPPETPPVSKTLIRSEGVINGKAKFLPKPPYPAAARAVKAGGEVSVQVTIDEGGRVISAKAVSGHPLLLQTAERAARNAKFDPTLLSKQPVKVTGVIVYKFLSN